jgi:hypothetical protein
MSNCADDWVGEAFRIAETVIPRLTYEAARAKERELMLLTLGDIRIAASDIRNALMNARHNVPMKRGENHEETYPYQHHRP